MDCLRKTLKPRGRAIIGTFLPEAPPHCGGVPVERYTIKTMAPPSLRPTTPPQGGERVYPAPG